MQMTCEELGPLKHAAVLLQKAFITGVGALGSIVLHLGGGGLSLMTSGHDSVRRHQHPWMSETPPPFPELVGPDVGVVGRPPPHLGPSVNVTWVRPLFQRQR